MEDKKRRVEDISNGRIGSKEIHKILSSELDIPITVIETVIERYWGVILEEISKSHRIVIMNMITLTPKYIHPFTIITKEGKSLDFQGGVSIYMNQGRLVREAKKVITEELNRNK